MTRKLLAADDVKAAIVAMLRKQFNLKQTAEWERRIAEALDAIPAAEGAGKPPMLWATITLAPSAPPSWWFRTLDGVWSSVKGGVFVATWLTVDRTASDPEALKLYDADLAASNPNP